MREAVHLRGAPARTHCCCMRCAHGGDDAPPTTRGARTPKVKIFQESSNLVINTAEGKGDMLINGRSLKGLFATVADLEDDVNAMTTASAPPHPNAHMCGLPVRADGTRHPKSQKPQPTTQKFGPALATARARASSASDGGGTRAAFG